MRAGFLRFVRGYGFALRGEAPSYAQAAVWRQIRSATNFAQKVVVGAALNDVDTKLKKFLSYKIFHGVAVVD